MVVANDGISPILGEMIQLDLCIFFANGWHNHQLEGPGVFFLIWFLLIKDYEEGTWKLVRDTCRKHQKPRLFHSSRMFYRNQRFQKVEAR